MAISYRDERQAAIFPILCVYRQAGINLKLAECMQKTCINLNTRLHKNRSSINQSINQHHKNVKIPSPGGRSVYTNKTDSVLSLSV